MAAEPSGTSEGVTRRDALRLTAAGSAVAVAPTVAAQDGNTTDPEDGSTDDDPTTYEPPDEFIGNAQSAIGADKMLIGALKFDSSERTPDGFTDAVLQGVSSYAHLYTPGEDPYYDTPTDLDDAASNGILKIDKMDNSDHHVLTGMFNEIQLATDKAWFDGMVAFLEEVDKGNDQSTCVNAATSAGVASQARIQGNLLTWWKEQLNQLKGFRVYLNESFDWSSHSNSLSDVLTMNVSNTSGAAYPYYWTGNEWTMPEKTMTLVDGTTVEGVPGIAYPTSRDNSDAIIDETIYPNSTPGDPQSSGVVLVSLPDGSVTNGLLGWDISRPRTKEELMTAVEDQGYAGPAEAFESELDSNLRRANMYNVLWDFLVQEADLIEANLNEWANNSYGEIQAGTIDIAGIVQANPTLAASEFATEYSSTGRYTYAAASMASMGVSYDYEHEMHVQLHDGTELTGTMLVSQSDFNVEVGKTIDPDDLSDEGHVYFAYDAGSARRELTTNDYQESIDGGVATLTSTPVEGTVYILTTIEDETVEISNDQWEPEDEDAAQDPDSSTNWTIDLSEELDTVITSIDSIVHEYSEGTGSDLIRLQEPFQIVEAYDVESGDPVDDVSGEQGTDLSETDVQFTQEDLEAFREMVDAVSEDSERPPAQGGPTFNLPDVPGVPSVGPIDSLGRWLLAGLGIVGGGYGVAKASGGNNGRARK